MTDLGYDRSEIPDAVHAQEPPTPVATAGDSSTMPQINDARKPRYASYGHGSRPGDVSSPKSNDIHASASLNITYFSFMNIRGLMPRTLPTKVPYVRDLLISENRLFFALTETWLRDQKDAEISIPGYCIFRQDRKRPKKNRGRDSGGVCIYIREDVGNTAEVVINYSDGVIEMLGIYVKSSDLLIVVLYRQPDDIVGGHRSTSVECAKALTYLSDYLAQQNDPSPEFMFCGDFDLPHIEWPGCTLKSGASRDERTMFECLSKFTADNFLIQKIECPTHKGGNTLDLLFINNDNAFHGYDCTETTVSDHHIMECRSLYMRPDLSSSVKPELGGFQSMNFHSENVDWDGIDDRLSQIDWVTEFSGKDPEQMLKLFLET